MPYLHRTPLGVTITGIVCPTAGENCNSNGYTQATHCMMAQTTGSELDRNHPSEREAVFCAYRRIFLF